MELIIIALICIGLCYKWGDWKNWKLYYPTLLFYIIADLTHEAIDDNKNLWLIHYSFWNDTTADYFIAFIIAPCIIILFLTNYPKRIIQQVLFIFYFVGILTFIEYIAYLNKKIFFYNGWNIGWSILLYIGTFPLLRLHYKKPLMGWLIFFILLVGGIIYFKISLSDLEIK